MSRISPTEVRPNPQDPLSLAQAIQRVAEFSTEQDARTVSADYTIDTLDDLVLVDTTTGSVTITLPLIVSVAPSAAVLGVGVEQAQRKLYMVKKVAAANTVTMVGQNGELVDGAASKGLTALNQAVVLLHNGVAWQCVGECAAPGGAGGGARSYGYIHTDVLASTIPTLPTVYIKPAGTTALDLANNFDKGGDEFRLRYTGADPHVFKVSTAATILDLQVAGLDTYGIALGLNGVVPTQSISNVRGQNQTSVTALFDQQVVHTQQLFTLNTNDFVELFAAPINHNTAFSVRFVNMVAEQVD